MIKRNERKKKKKPKNKIRSEDGRQQEVGDKW